jgi:alkanesulfonate monooxygenase SsuD/methylene tetrahydromethanopterin reductase-like flavin-dependent oxidoreductase (luciferase family)
VTVERQLGIVLSTVADAVVAEFPEFGALAESLGYDAVLVSEGRGDALAASQAIAAVTERVKVGTNIANIYYRHPFLCAATARTVSDLSGGRLLLGLGMSHRQMLASLGIDMGDARARLREYVDYVRRALVGEIRRGLLSSVPPLHPVPVYVAGNTVESAALAGELGDGLMPYVTPRSHLPLLLDAARAAAAAAGRDPSSFRCCLSLPTFVSEDETAARSAARYNLAYFAQLPNYRRQWRRAGFGAAMDAVRSALERGERRDAARQIPDELVDEVCVFGTPAQCRARLDAFRAAGVDLPLLAVSPVDEDRATATRRALTALAPVGGR